MNFLTEKHLEKITNIEETILNYEYIIEKVL
jgi:hypothetical protein